MLVSHPAIIIVPFFIYNIRLYFNLLHLFNCLSRTQLIPEELLSTHSGILIAVSNGYRHHENQLRVK